MQGDFSSFLVLIVFFCFMLLLSFIFKKNKGRDPASLVKPKAPLPQKKVLPKQVAPPLTTQKKASSYVVEKKASKPFLNQDWKKGDSLRKAFVLSEVLRRWDDSSSKF